MLGKILKLSFFLPDPCHQKRELEGGDQGEEGAEESAPKGVHGGNCSQ